MTPIRYYCDENVNRRVATFLRVAGIDVQTARGAGLLGMADRLHLLHARREGRMLITHDFHFLRLAEEYSDHAGLVLLALPMNDPQVIANRLFAFHDAHTAEDVRGKVIVIK